MNERKDLQARVLRRWLALFAVLVLAWSVSCASSPTTSPEGEATDADSPTDTSLSADMVAVIVQGAPDADLVAIVAQFGGEVTRDLAVISAVAANVPADQLSALEQAEGIRHVWLDTGVESSGGLLPIASGAQARPEADLWLPTQ